MHSGRMFMRPRTPTTRSSGQGTFGVDTRRARCQRNLAPTSTDRTLSLATEPDEAILLY